MKATFQFNRHLIRILTLMAFTVMFTVACTSGKSNDGDAPPDITDTDGDGLTDAEELVLGTSIRMKDSDGDGLSDFVEVIDRGFNPELNALYFNPLIADVPKFRIEMTSLPNVTMDYVTTTGTATSVTVGREEAVAIGQSVSDSSSNSSAVENSHTVGVSATVSYSPDGFGGSATASYEETETTTSESSFSNTQEQSEEYSTALSESESLENSNEYTSNGGKLQVSLKIVNEGIVGFKLESILLNSAMADGTKGGSLNPIGNLEIDGDSFTGVTLGPGQSTLALSFTKDLLLDEAKSILRDSTGIVVGVASREVVNVDGVGFGFTDASVQANTASIILDFSGLRPSERYLVATMGGTVTAGEVLADILRIPYAVDNNGSLDSVRNYSYSTLYPAYWLGIHVTSNGVESNVTELDPTSAGYDFKNIILKAGDVLELAYFEDRDEDGLGLRGEIRVGSDPDDPDSDNDKLTDSEEVFGYDLKVDYGQGAGEETIRVSSNPTQDDSDGDTILDNIELNANKTFWLSSPVSTDTDNDLIPDTIDTAEPAIYNNIQIENFTLESDGKVPPASVVSFDYDIDESLSVYYQVVRQTQPIAGTFGSDYSNYTEVGGRLASSAFSFTGNFTDTETLAEALGVNLKHRYRIYAEVNDNGGSERILLDEKTMNTAASFIDIEFDLTRIDVTKCIDTWTDANGECELYWGGYIASNSGDYDRIEKIQAASVRVEAGDSPALIDQTMNIQIPDVENSCFEVRLVMYETDDLSADNNSLSMDDSYSDYLCASEFSSWSERDVLHTFSLTKLIFIPTEGYKEEILEFNAYFTIRGTR
jgi:hypothetical protein